MNGVRERIRAWGLLGRFAAYLIAFSSVMTLLVTSIELVSEYQHDLQKINERMAQIEETYLESVSEHVWINDWSHLEVLLAGIARLPDVVYAEIRIDHETVMNQGFARAEPGVVRVFPVYREHKGRQLLIGELEVHASFESARASVVRHLINLVIFNGIKMVLVAAFIFWLFYRLFGRHLQQVAEHAQKDQQPGQRPAPLKLDRDEPAYPDELSRLVCAFNRMQSDLLALHDSERDRAQRLQNELIERQRMEESLLIMATVFASSREAILITDNKNRIIATNDAFSHVTGYLREEVLGKDPKILSAGRSTALLYQQMWRDLRTQGHWEGEVWDRRKDGSVYPKWLAITAVRNDDAELVNYIGVFSDITERKATEARIYQLAHHDNLTGLSNRVSLMVEFGHALRHAKQEEHALAVMFIDLDEFKEINDIHGHGVGDQLLLQVANRLQQSVREGDLVARLGGDEFVIVLTHVTDREAALHVAEKVRASLETPYGVGSLQLRTASSIGLAMYPDDGETSEQLMKSADTAMYHAKSNGRNNVQVYSEGMESAFLERVWLVRELRQALDQNQFELHYQPQYAADGQMIGVEALLRWKHPEQGWMAPAKFIPAAEQSGLILPLGDWVLHEACRQWKSWQDEQCQSHFRMAINLSAQQLAKANLVETVEKLIDFYGLPPDSLELEITESMLMEDIESNIRKLTALRDMGIKLSIDDFGTGYSSLSYLKLLPIHTLKLDRSFVHDVEHDSSNAAICLSIIALAHNLGLEVVAEGVETIAQRDFLLKHGCDTLQGYLLGRPVPATQVFGH